MTELLGQRFHRDSYVLPISDPGVIGFEGDTVALELETIPEPSSFVLSALGLAVRVRRARR